jgi:hypothetical protein
MKEGGRIKKHCSFVDMLEDIIAVEISKDLKLESLGAHQFYRQMTGR